VEHASIAAAQLITCGVTFVLGMRHCPCFSQFQPRLTPKGLQHETQGHRGGLALSLWQAIDGYYSKGFGVAFMFNRRSSHC